MIQIKVLGPGCRSFKAVEQMAAAGLMEIINGNPDFEATIEHIEDLDAILKYPILVTPGLVINERLVCAGRVPNKKEVVQWITQELEKKA